MTRPVDSDEIMIGDTAIAFTIEGGVQQEPLSRDAPVSMATIGLDMADLAGSVARNQFSGRLIDRVTAVESAPDIRSRPRQEFAAHGFGTYLARCRRGEKSSRA